MMVTGFYVRNGHEVTIKKELNKVALGAGAVFMVLHSEPAHAGNINQSMQPIINVLKDLAEPVSYGFMIKGFMRMMAGDEHEGYKTIKLSAGGFIGIQWIPFIFKTIKSIQF